MSLGSSFGVRNTPDSVAATNAAKAGIVVVTSAGNNGPSQYITGSPGAASNVISTAANESLSSFPGYPEPPVGLPPTRSSGSTRTERRTSRTGRSTRSCRSTTTRRRQPSTSRSAAASRTSRRAERHVDGGRHPGRLRPRGEGDLRPAGRVRRSRDGEQRNEPPRRSRGRSSRTRTRASRSPSRSRSSASAASPRRRRRTVELRAASGSLTTVNNTSVSNPNFSGLASFTSGGPRTGDSLKPWITAPGVSIFSTGVGTGNLPGGTPERRWRPRTSRASRPSSGRPTRAGSATS